MWKFFNSPIIVVMAVVVIGYFGGGVILRIVDEGKIQQKDMLVAEKLKIEIDYRATQTKKYLENIVRYIESDEIDKLVKTVSELLVHVSGLAENDQYTNLFSEYADQSMASLLSQLKLLSRPDSGMQKILDAAVASTVELQSMSADIHSNKPKTTITELIEGTKKLLEDLGAVTGKSYLTNGENSD